MSDEAKSIKFKFVVDEQSAQRVNTVLDGMIKRAETLAKTLQGVGIGGGGGMFGGGSVGGRAPSAQSTMATSGSSTQKVSFASVLTQNVDMFKKIAQEGGTAMKALGDAVNRGSDHQRREIDKLQRSLENLAKTYDRLGGAGGQHADKLQQKILGVQQRISGHQGQLAKLQSMAPPGGPHQELMPEIPWPTAPKAGMFARFRGFLNSGGGIGGEDLTMANMSRNMSRIPGLSMLGGVGGGLAMAGAGAFMSAGLGAAKSQASAAWNAPQLAAQARAEFGGDMSTYSRKLRAGDYSDIRAMNAIESDPTRRAEYETIQKPGWFRRQINRVGAAKDAFSERGFKEGFSELFEGVDGYNYNKNLRQALREKVNTTIEERGVLEDIDREATGNALGKMGMMRALGVGDGRKKTGAYRSNAERLLNAYASFDPGEVAGAVQGIGGSGARGSAYAKQSDGGYSLLSRVLQAQAGGITGAAHMAGIFGRQGPDAGGNMIDLLRSVGGAGTDVSTVGVVGSYLAQAQDRFNLPSTGSGALGALSFGTAGPAGNMIARQNIGGMENFQQLLAGSRDPAQRAQNFANAIRSAPEAGYYAQEYLATKLDARRIADVLGGDYELTPQERQLGINEDMLKKQVEATTKSQGFRAMRKGFAPGSPAGDFTKEMAAGGNIRDIAKRMFGDDKDAATETFATVLAAGNQNMSFGDAMGAARLQLFGLGEQAKKGGKMISDVAGGSLEAKVAREEAEKKKTDLDLKDASMDRLEQETVGVGKAYKRLVTNSENLAITADNIATIIKTFSDNLKAAAGGRAPGAAQKVAPK